MNMQISKSIHVFIALMAATILCATASTGGGGMPWESGVTTLKDSLTGPVAVGIVLIGIVATGATLIFAGGEIQGFIQKLVYIVLVGSIILGSAQLVMAFWGTSALIPAMVIAGI